MPGKQGKPKKVYTNGVQHWSEFGLIIHCGTLKTPEPKTRYERTLELLRANYKNN